MPPTPSRVSDQFSPTDSEGRSSMVLCNHCQIQKVPRNSLQRKEEHLRSCTAFGLSPLSTETNAHGLTLLEASIAARGQRLKPGNTKERRRISAVAAAAAAGGGANGAAQSYTNSPGSLQERVERIIRGERAAAAAAATNAPSSAPQTRTSTSESNYSTLPFNNYSPYSPYETEQAATVGEGTLSALLEKSNGNTTDHNTGNGNGMPRKRPATDALSLDLSNNNNNNNDPTRTPSVTPCASSALAPTETATATATNTFTPTPTTAQNSGPPAAKRLKFAELYLDEDEFGFVCSAQTVRERRFATIVERLARLVRLRDTR